MRGTLSPTHKSGRYSKYLPEHLAARAEEIRTNPQLLSMSDDIALLELREAELCAMLDTGEAGAVWEEALETMEGFSAALAEGRMGDMHLLFGRLRELVSRGAGAPKVWRELRDVQETRARLVTTEVRTLQGLQQMVTAQQCELFLGAAMQEVVDAVQAEVSKTVAAKILGRIQRTFTKLLHVEPGKMVR